MTHPTKLRLVSIFRRPTARLSFPSGLKFSEIVRATLRGFLAADPTGFGNDEVAGNGLVAVRAFHAARILRGSLIV
jgi:hypothetical protein